MIVLCLQGRHRAADLTKECLHNGMAAMLSVIVLWHDTTLHKFSNKQMSSPPGSLATYNLAFCPEFSNYTQKCAYRLSLHKDILVQIK